MEFCKLGVLLLAQQHYDMFIIVSGTSTYYGGANIAMAAYLGGGTVAKPKMKSFYRCQYLSTRMT